MRVGDLVLLRGIYHGSVRWKDGDDVAQARRLGVFDEQGAAEIHAERERITADRPQPTGREGWRLPVEWSPLPLPGDWHVV